MDLQEFYLNQSLDHECFKLPEKDKKYLLKNNFLNEYFSEEDKAQVRSNLGITTLLDELKSFILAKLFDEEGNVTFDLEPHEDASDKVLSSAVIYSILLKYYTKEELDEWRESLITEIYNRILELLDSIHIDDLLDENSEYPVLNKVLYQIFNLINNAYSRLSDYKVDKELLLNYYNIDEINDIIGGYYTKELSDNADLLLTGKITEAVQYLSQIIEELRQNLNEKIDLQRTSSNNILLLIDGINLLISSLDQEIEQLDLEISLIPTEVVSADNKTIKKLDGVLSTLLTIHKSTENNVDSYELLNSNGERIGDKIIISNSNQSQIIELLLQQIQELQRLQLKYIIVDESTYEQLTNYVQGAIYLVLEDGESVNNTGWKLGDGLPIILSGEWLFGDNLPIILS